MKMELTAIFRGRVQGVSFRYNVQKMAMNLELKGYAINLNDLSVEVKAVGEKKVLDDFILLILKNPGRAEIIKYDTKFSSPSVEYQDFSIR
jgi:acylphosphatase